MKHLIFILIFVILGCGEDKPTQNDDNKILDEEKYTIDELEQNPDWVEITDIDTLEKYCVKKEYRIGGKLLKNHQEYFDLYQKSKDEVNCPNNSDSLNVNYNERDVIMAVFSGPPSKWVRKIFKNEENEIVRFALEIRIQSREKKLDWWFETISVPKISNNYQFLVDTLQIVPE